VLQTSFMVNNESQRWVRLLTQASGSKNKLNWVFFLVHEQYMSWGYL
jgi:hypothetical protein